MKKNFSFKEYEKIILKYKNQIKDFKEIKKNTRTFCLIRHDVEFSIQRALKIAKIDNKLGIKSSFFFQVRNSCYNGISVETISVMKQILKFGHYIGLHFYISNLKNNKKEVLKELNIQVKILESALGKKIDRISVHRPNKWILKQKRNFFKPYINTYSDLYFEFNKDPKKIKYYSDSNHKWTYGHPIENKEFNKCQILLHPDEWSVKGSDEKNNLINLIYENKFAFINSINNEYKTFKLYFKKNKWKKI